MALFQNLATRRAIIDLLIAVGGTYETVTLHTFQQPFSPGLNDTLADLDAIESDYVGYGVITPVVWGTTFDNAAGQAVNLGGLVQWNCTDDTKPQDVYGTYWEAGAALVGVEVYDTPLPARAAFDAIPYIPTLAYPA